MLSDYNIQYYILRNITSPNEYIIFSLLYSLCIGIISYHIIMSGFKGKIKESTSFILITIIISYNTLMYIDSQIDKEDYRKLNPFCYVDFNYKPIQGCLIGFNFLNQK